MEQIRGNADVNESDIKLVMSQTQTTRDQTIRALKRHPNDILGAILEVSASKDNNESDDNESEDKSDDEESDDESETSSDVDEADIKLVMAQTQTSRDRAIEALKQHHNDLLGAILEITKN